MFRQLEINVFNTDDNGICLAQQLGAAGPLALNGALVSGGQFSIQNAGLGAVSGVPIGIKSSGDLSAVTFTVTGKDFTGADRTEQITGPTSSTSKSNVRWSVVTGITADAGFVDDVTVGTTSGTFYSSIVPLNWRNDFPATFESDVNIDQVNFSISELGTGTPLSDLIFVTSNEGSSYIERYATAVYFEFGSPDSDVVILVRQQDYNS